MVSKLRLAAYTTGAPASAAINTSAVTNPTFLMATSPSLQVYSLFPEGGDMIISSENMFILLLDYFLGEQIENMPRRS